MELETPLRSHLTKPTALKVDPPWSSSDTPNVDFWNILSFDYSVPDRVVAQSNLYPYNFNQSWVTQNTDDVMRFYSTRIPLTKVNLGIPLFGRNYCDTTPPLGSPYVICKDRERVPFNQLPIDPNFEPGPVTAFSYDRDRQELISYDDLQVLDEKYHYLFSQDVGGFMFWDLSGDRIDNLSGDRIDNLSLVCAVSRQKT
jgi:chitinase